jgi:hypothetical protein
MPGRVVFLIGAYIIVRNKATSATVLVALLGSRIT